ncbi:hypothetical protein HYS94_03480 [Candidatus Daviesbacteria bacterium]|nr:hypothetical protein [Candidatus Daviesbacteria bacterium]
MDQQILTTILNDTFTVTQLKHRLVMLKSYLTKKLFGTSDETNLEQTDLNWLSSLGEAFYQKFTKDNVYQILNDLQTQTNQIVPLTIYLPFEVEQSSSAQIGSFARTSFNHPTLLLEVRYDPTLIAGCALSWKGIYRDYSLKAKIEDKKEEILTTFKSFLR